MLKKSCYGFNLAYAMLFIISLGASIIPPLVGPLFLHPPSLLPGENLYVRLNAYSFTVGIYGIGAILGGFFWGMHSDRVGEKKTLLICLIGSLIAHFLSILGLTFINFWLFFLGRALDGLMSGRRAVILSLLTRTDSPKTKFFRMAEIMNALGLFFGPLLCGILVNFKSTVPLYYYVSPFCFILFLILINLSFLPAIHALPPKSSTERRPVLWSDYANPLFVEFFLVQSVWCLYYIAVVPFAILCFHFSSYTIGLMFSAMVLLYIFFLASTQKILLNRIGAAAAKKMAMLFLVFGFLGIGVCRTNLPVFAVANVCIILAFSILNPAYLAAMSNARTAEHQGQIMGLLTSLNGLASMLTAMLVGSLLSLSLHLPFLLNALLAAVIYLSYVHRQVRHRGSA